MPPPQRRRGVPAEDDEEMENPQRGAGSGPESQDEEESDGGDPMNGVRRDTATEEQLVKRLVRYALACEYSRTPIRREGIKEKVLGPNGRAFRKVFAGAQKQLIAAFGMEMVELPAKDRSVMSLDQKRKAGKSQTQGQTSSNAYILVSTLPAAYRVPAIIAPSKAQSQEGEASYVGLYSTIVAIITLSGGELSDARMRRHLQRLVVDKNMPSLNPNDGNRATENTELVLQRMIKQGYLVKTSESKMQGDDDTITWHVGPRGKVEVTNEAIAGIVRMVYGGSSPELEKKLQGTLKVAERADADESEPVEDVADQSRNDGHAEAGPSAVRRSRRRAAAHDDDDE